MLTFGTIFSNPDNKQTAYYVLDPVHRSDCIELYRAVLVSKEFRKGLADSFVERHGATPGQLTDNFNPTNKTVNLSQAVYAQTNVAAAAVAAHECGHAVQHATGYFPVKLRSALVPVVSITSKIVPFVLLGGMLLVNILPQLIWVGIALFALSTLFSFVTLPVEIDASRRALAWLNQSDIIDPSTEDEARGALRAAAYTYVVAALSALATLIYYLSIFSGRRS